MHVQDRLIIQSKSSHVLAMGVATLLPNFSGWLNTSLVFFAAAQAYTI